MKIKRIVINNFIIAWGMIVIIVGLMVARDIFGILVNKYIFVALAGIALFLVDKYQMNELLAFLIPLFAGLPGNYISCIALLLFVVRSKGKLVLDKAGFIYVASILVIELMAEIASGIKGYSFSIIDYVKFMGAFLITFIVVFDADSQYDYWNIVRNFLFGLMFAIAIIIGEMLVHYSIAEFLSLGVRIGEAPEITGQLMEGMSLSYNSNALGMFCASSIMVCLIARVKYGRKWVIFAGVLFLLIGIMTQSRAFVVSLLFGIVIFIITGNDKPSTMLKKFVVLLISAAVVGFIVKSFIPSYFESLLGRFQDADISNGRIDISSEYWERFVGNSNVFEVLFGVGLQNYQSKYGMTMSAHLGFEEVLITWGFVGITCVLLMLFQMVKLLKYKNLCEYSMLIPFGVYLFGLQSGQFFSNTTAFMSLLVWISFAKIKREKVSVKRNTVVKYWD